MAWWSFRKRTLPLDVLKRLDVLMEERKLQEAAEEGEGLLGRYPTPELRNKLCDIYKRLGNPAEAARHLKEALALSHAQDPARMRELADLLMRGARWDEARGVIERMLDRDPESPELRTLVARSYRLSGDLDQAAMLTERLVSRTPKCMEARKERALCQLDARDYEKAFQDFLQMVERFKEDAEFLEGWGLCAYHTGRARVAKRCFKRAIRLDPSRVKSRFYLGCIYMDAGRFNRAFPHLKEAAAGMPKTEELLSRLRDAALEMGEFDEAYRCAVRQSVAAGDDASRWKKLGGDFLSKGATRHASDAFRHAYCLDISDMEVAGRWLELAVETDGKDNALRHLRDLATRHEKAIEPLILLAKVSTTTGDFAGAEEALRRADALQQNHPQVMELRNRLRGAQGAAGAG
ncbi:MAG: tetratricopeptide repeat protein [Planctomycetota bacterium]